MSDFRVIRTQHPSLTESQVAEAVIHLNRKLIEGDSGGTGYTTVRCCYLRTAIELLTEAVPED